MTSPRLSRTRTGGCYVYGPTPSESRVARRAAPACVTAPISIGSTHAVPKVTPVGYRSVRMYSRPYEAYMHVYVARRSPVAAWGSTSDTVVILEYGIYSTEYMYLVSNNAFLPTGRILRGTAARSVSGTLYMTRCWHPVKSALSSAIVFPGVSYNGLVVMSRYPCVQYTKGRQKGLGRTYVADGSISLLSNHSKRLRGAFNTV